MPVADFQGDLDEMIEDFPSVLVIDGREIPCFRGALLAREDFQDGGQHEDDSSVDVMAYVAKFDSKPPYNKSVTLDDVAYRVDSVSTEMGGTAYLISLTSAHK